MVKGRITSWFLVDLENFVSTLAVVCDVLEEVEMLLLAVCRDSQTIEQQTLFEVNVFDGISVDPVFALTKTASSYEGQVVCIDVQVTD
jgi:hypothetical protein